MITPGRSCPDLYTQPDAEDDLTMTKQKFIPNGHVASKHVESSAKKNKDLSLDLSEVSFTHPTPGQKCFGKKSDVERVLDSRCPCLQSKCLHLSGSLLLFLLVGAVLVFFFRHYLKDFLEWLENVNGWISGLLFIGMFTIVSFPMTWGYIVLNVAAGYLYGFLIGVVTVTVSVVVGVASSLIICRIFIRDFVQSKLQSEHLKAIIKVVESRRGFKVVVLTRLTPIPFGLQNGLFAITNMSVCKCLLASFIGLLPTQALNAYMGSTLRTMEDVVHHNSAGGYLILAIQVGISGFLMWYVIRRARYELNKACLPTTYDGLGTKQDYAMTPQPLQRTVSTNFFGHVYHPVPTSSVDDVSMGAEVSKKQGHKRAHSASAVLYAMEHNNDDL
ncbi:transmembrane protein 64-like [Hydractinia symbiolongicarpus]|uniref:transmembrane protein 64-like n=1 Tax=Hydractinia symbiolongicarpus TaxID=13093 RepID=UPI00254D8031|nr:transmembrane protein 64-like [Hydractinia symbiolongicarpus]XP_057291511.1 transmembrane protein 64-like [Hydractinia symbiolongicarpus]